MPDRIELQKKAKGARPQYFEDPAIDKVLSITLALAGEMAVMRDRLDTLERLLENGSLVSRNSIDRFHPDQKVREERDAWRETFLSNILRIVHQEREDLTYGSTEPTSYDQAIESVELAAET